MNESPFKHSIDHNPLEDFKRHITDLIEQDGGKTSRFSGMDAECLTDQELQTYEQAAAGQFDSPEGIEDFRALHHAVIDQLQQLPDGPERRSRTKFYSFIANYISERMYQQMMDKKA